MPIELPQVSIVLLFVYFNQTRSTVQIPQSQTVDIVIDPVNKRANNNNPLSQHGCPDLSELLNEIGLPEDTVTGNPFLQANKSQEV